MLDAVGRRRFLAVLGAAAMPISAWSSTPSEVTDGSFRREVMALMRGKFPGRSVEAGGDPMSIRFGNTMISLDNIQKTVSGLTGSDRRQAILAFLGSVTSVDAGKPGSAAFEDIGKKLRIQIAPVAFVSGNTRILHRPLSGDTVQAVVVDRVSDYAYVSESDVIAWSVSASAVFERGIGNLDDASKKVHVNVVSGAGVEDRCMIVHLADGFCAARLLCPEFMRGAHRKLSAKIFVAVPARDFLVAWTENFAKKQLLSQQVGKLFSEMDHPLTQEVFVSEKGQLRLADAGELIAMRDR